MDKKHTPWLTPESVSLLENIIENNPDVKILEFGCGGSSVWISKQMKSADCRLISIALDAKSAKQIKAKVSENTEIKVAKTPHEACSQFSDESFDVVLINGKHNLLNAAFAMRVVKPGGFVFLADADHQEYDPIRNVLLKDWEYKRNANYLQSAADMPPTTDIWRKPSVKSVADVADDTLVSHAETSVHKRDFERAEIIARMSVERNANMANALNILAITSAVKNQPTDALFILESGRILDPNHPNIGKNLAHVLTGLGRKEEALAVYKEMLAIYPDDEDVIQGIAELEPKASAEPLEPTQTEVIENNMQPEIIENTVEATPEWLAGMAARINQANGDQKKLIDIAGELAERGHEDTAEELARAIIRDNPNFAESYNVLGFVYFNRERFEDALRYFDKAYKLEPSNADFGKNLVWMRIHFAQFEEAVETCQEMVRNCEPNQDLANTVGELLETISEQAFDNMDMSQLAAAAESIAQPTEPVNVVAARTPSVQPKLKYSFGALVSGEESIESALKSVYDVAHEIIVVEGPVGDAKSKASGEKAIEMIQSFPDPDKKISVIRGRWADKTEQSNAYIKMATGDYVWEINPGETYSPENLRELDEILADNRDCVDMVSFAISGDQKSEPMIRIFKHEPDCYFAEMESPRVVYTNAKERGHLEADTLAEDFSIFMQVEPQPKMKKLSKKQLAKL